MQLRPTTTDPDAKSINTPVLELKSDLQHIQTMREVLLQSQLLLRAFGVFIPPAFLKDKPQAVYNTALRHTQFLHRLRVIPVSGIHQTLLQKTINTDAEVTDYRLFFGGTPEKHDSK